MPTPKLKQLWPALSALALCTAAGYGHAATNLALGKTATASTTENTVFTAAAAVDGDGGTRWSSSFVDPSWLSVDLGSAQTINRVVLKWEAAAAKAYQIQVSTNGTTWTTVYTQAAGTGGTEDLSFAAVSARYVRMYGTTRTTAYGYSLYEMEVYGTQQYVITATAGANGSISPANATVTAGASQAFTITPASGYTVDTVTVDGASVGAVTSYNFTNVQAAHAINATFKQLATGDLAQGKLATASSVENAGTPASAAFDGNLGTRWASAFVDPSWIAVDLGTSQAIGRVVLRWEAAYGKAYTIQVSNDNTNWTTVYTQAAGTGGNETINFNTVSARYVRMNGTARGTAWGYSLWAFEVYAGNPTPTFNITASAGANGSITPNGSTSVAQGGSQVYTITPASGYAVDTVTVDGVSKGAITTYTFSNVTAAHTISATFKSSVSTYNITATAGSNGSITPTGTTSVTKGGSQVYTITPASGYVVEGVTVDGASQGAITTYTFSNVTAAHTINATFKANNGMLWSEEFDGTTIDTTKWSFDIGTGANNDGWGNGEWEYYTNSSTNAAIENGSLVITLNREDFGGKPFTSARLVTRGKFSFNHGRMVARIKMPQGNMVWPAFWLLGDHSDGWPKCGELDIAEMFCGAVGQGDNAVFSTAHWFHDLPAPGGYANYGQTRTYTEALANAYHEYELVWDSQYVIGKMDGVEHWKMGITDPSLAELKDNFYYFILNVAAGQPQYKMTSASQLDGPVPQKMYVDWIRVYQTEDGSAKVLDKAAIQPTGNYGIIADGSGCPSQLTLGTDANFYLWNNLTAVTGTPKAGASSIALKTNDTSWFGFGVASTVRKNMMKFAGGYLNFAMKTTSATPFKVGVGGGAVGDSWVSFPGTTDPYGFKRDGQWHTVSIPMNKFGSSDFTDIAQFFMFVSDGAVVAGQTFEFDEIYWSPNAAENIVKPAGTRFGLYTDRACDAGIFNPATDGGIFVWNTANNQVLGSTPFEGANSYAFSAPQAQWYGMGFTPTKLYDLSAFAKGYLHISLKIPASSTSTFKLGLKSPGGQAIRESWVKFANGADPYGMVRDGKYHELKIPASAFNNSDFSAIAQLLMISGDGPAQMEFDDVYWSAN